MAYKRHNVSVIKDRINEQRRFIQIVIGPRQTGKTTAVLSSVFRKRNSGTPSLLHYFVFTALL